MPRAVTSRLKYNGLEHENQVANTAGKQLNSPDWCVFMTNEKVYIPVLNE